MEWQPRAATCLHGEPMWCDVQKASHPEYATKSKTRSKGLRAEYGNIMKGLDDSLQVARKLLIISVGDRDYSAQETCQQLQGITWLWVTWGGCQFEWWKQQWHCIHSLCPPCHPTFRGAQYLAVCSEVQDSWWRAHSQVIIRPYCSPEPSGPSIVSRSLWLTSHSVN